MCSLQSHSEGKGLASPRRGRGGSGPEGGWVSRGGAGVWRGYGGVGAEVRLGWGGGKVEGEVGVRWMEYGGQGCGSAGQGVGLGQRWGRVE